MNPAGPWPSISISPMKQLLLVAVGGALGSVLRWWFAGLVLGHTTQWRFPLGTFVVNILGCFFVGLIAGLSARHDAFSADTRLLLFTGLAGGFTTFSAFGLETFQLLRRHEYLAACGYSLLSVVCGVLALWLAFAAIPGKPST